MQDEKAGASVKSLQVALDILETIASSREEVGISEIAIRVGMTKGSVFRYVRTLTERGYLTQNVMTSRYGLGTQLHVMGELASSRIDLISASDAIMRQLRDKLNLTINLAGATANGVTILRSLVGTLVMEIGVRVGMELPYSATSQGRVIMAFSKRPILPSLKRLKLPSFTEYTVTDFAKIEEIVTKAHQQGWAMAPQETVVGINAVSAPIFSADGDCQAALTLVGSMQFLQPDEQQLEALFSAGERISAALGYRGIYRKGLAA
jgi:DNA-binding IclR family transcriptional regulator